MGTPTEIHVSPYFALSLHGEREFPALSQAFEHSWTGGWFDLAAHKISCGHLPTLHFWQVIAKAFLSKLRLISFKEKEGLVPPPSPEQLNQWLLFAPPMRGGEYVTTYSLLSMWEALNGWVKKELGNFRSLKEFLKTRAPLWYVTSPICFHLVENKQDSSFPFAFLATFVSEIEGKSAHNPLQKLLANATSRNALEEFVALIHPITVAAKTCTWVHDLLHSKKIFQPLKWTAGQAYAFLKSIPTLESAQIKVRIPNWWKKRPHPRISMTIGTNMGTKLGADAFLDFDAKVVLNGRELSEKEIQEMAQANSTLLNLRGEWIEVDAEKLKEALNHWEAIKLKTKTGNLSFFEGMRLLSSPLSQQEDGESEPSWSDVTPGKDLASFLQKLKNPSSLPHTLGIDRLKATLRPYQTEGVRYLHFLSNLQLGACLADDMGLGKTMQILALLLNQKERKRPSSLLVVPASLLGTWKREASRFAPTLNLLLVHPSEMDGIDEPMKLDAVDLVVTTYSMIFRKQWLQELEWNLVILDEAQAIKNPGTKQSLATKKLRSQARIALTGTPIENRLSDLWSLFDFLNPGLLGSSNQFNEALKGMNGQFHALKSLVTPYILRRMKTDPKIISDLPEKIETPTFCELSPIQVSYYQSVVDNLKNKLNSAESIARKGIVLQSLMRLKQICNHPSQFDGMNGYEPKMSGKFVRLKEICTELADRQEKVLIFSQFKEIIPPLATFLEGVFGQKGLILHGSTPIKKRKELVELFQTENGPPFFVISLKAGGTGLTLTEATHVIHFDRWWNPAVENQATDRAYRIGQKRRVQVHKFITEGTIEEKIDTLIEEKKELATSILGEKSEIKLTELSNDELIQLVSLDIHKV